ncbi:glycine zipper family protein [Geobacter sp. AOG1]|uniref:glycine zipper family protein n=1 Tax=Geobacter sp. AOG1 TaxID=1566346 RepID=UPI001CC78EC0|nr:glycine zipper family protein [Geobacter sp. AOG1]GFE56994.1 lipoprotein [Geobacter sp. AOG1]
MKRLVSMLLCLALVSSCATYKTQYVSFKPPEAYPNFQVVAGAPMAAEAYADQAQATDAFGFDIRGAGLLPVQLVIDNKSGQTMEIVSGQTFLVDDNNRYWNVVANRAAVERVEQYTASGAMAAGAGKTAVVGAIAGTILGAAIGIVSGRNVGEALGKGAVLGAAGGAVIGGVQGGSDREREYRIADDIREKGLEGKAIPNAYLANGFIFFPGEALSAKELRMQVREKESGDTYSVMLKLK